METALNPGSELITPRERGFLRRITTKYDGRAKPLLRSLVIFTLLIAVAHVVERSSIPGWIAFLVIYLPAIWLFSRYRRFEIFKNRIVRKLVLQAGLFDDSTPRESSTCGHDHRA